jgi:hypothetical protein
MLKAKTLVVGVIRKTVDDEFLHTHQIFVCSFFTAGGLLQVWYMGPNKPAPFNDTHRNRTM